MGNCGCFRSTNEQGELGFADKNTPNPANLTDEEKAAIKIQATFRGKKTRKDLKSNAGKNPDSNTI